MINNSIKPAQIFKTIVKKLKEGKIKIKEIKDTPRRRGILLEIVLNSHNFNSI